MGQVNLPRAAAGVMLAAALGGLAPGAQAQTLPYGSAASDSESGADSGGASTGASTRHGSGKHRPGLRVTPYIEAMQVVGADLSPDHEVLTWSSLAAGVDGGYQTRNSEASFSLRYERRFGYGRAQSGDVISGLARAGIALVPHAVTLEAGGIATRTTVDGNSSGLPGSLDRAGSTRLWSVFAGPSLNTRSGDVALTAAYRVGYTEIGGSQSVVRNGAAANANLFDHSVIHNAEAHAGVAPGDLLPVGLGLGGGYYREDVSNFDQRVTNAHVRADLSYPVSSDVALVGGIGYEKVQVSSRDVLRVGGVPVIGSDGRYVTDHAGPRQIAYDTSGLIWDAGVTWRPSRRTALEAHVGRRYGDMTYYGSFGWKPSRRTSVNVSVYDSIAGFGGQLNRALTSLPTDFVVQRDPVSGDINGCVATLESGGCLTGAFAGLRSAVFRARGIQASYSVQIGRFDTGVAAGYDRRKFIAAPGTILASVNGVTDENAWLSAWFNGRIDRATTFNTYVFASWFTSGQVGGPEGTALGANAGLQHSFDNHLSANAAVSLSGIERKLVDDIWNASAVVGVRYSF